MPLDPSRAKWRSSKSFFPATARLQQHPSQSDGSVSLTFKGETTALFAPYYDLYPLETSSNLVDWAPLATLATHEYGAGHSAFPGYQRAGVQPALLPHADECIAHTYPSADRPLPCWDFLDAANRPVPH